MAALQLTCEDEEGGRLRSAGLASDLVLGAQGMVSLSVHLIEETCEGLSAQPRGCCTGATRHLRHFLLCLRSMGR